MLILSTTAGHGESMVEGHPQVMIEGKIQSKDGRWITCRIMVDSGATHSCVAAALVKKLNLQYAKTTQTARDFQNNESPLLGEIELQGVRLGPVEDDGSHSEGNISAFVSEMGEAYEVILGMPWWIANRANFVYAIDERDQAFVEGIYISPSGDASKSRTIKVKNCPLRFKNQPADFFTFDLNKETGQLIHRLEELRMERNIKSIENSKSDSTLEAVAQEAVTKIWQERCAHYSCEHDVALNLMCKECGRQAYECTPSVNKNDQIQISAWEPARPTTRTE